MKARFDRVQAALAEDPFDALVLIPGPNYRYVSGVSLHHSERLNLLVVPPSGRSAALAPRLEAPALEGLDLTLFTWRDEEGPERALRALVRDLKLEDTRLGIEYAQMRCGEAERLRAAVPRARLVPADDLLSSLRLVKDEDEATAMRRAIAITERALAATIATIHPGQTEAEVAAELQVQLLRAGSQASAFNPLVVSGARSANPHFGPSDKPLEPGDVVILDCGATWGGYVGDITRCVALEPVPEEIVVIYDLCRAANAAGREAMAPGVSCEAVDDAARTVIERGGYGPRFIHRTGHGLGLESHEPPYLVAGNRELLQAGMVCTVEPGIYIPDLGGVRVEDDMLVITRGSESLTGFSRDLIRIG